MKGCLKSPMPSPGIDSQVNSCNKPSDGARCCASSCTSSNTNTASTAQSPQIYRKCVAFCDKGSETVYTADEWDRTPTEPARKLSYQDLLELKEIQRSLPHANQPPDVVTGRPGKQFLSGVPIVLLPLLGSGSAASGGNCQSASDAEEDEAKKTSHLPDGQGRTNGRANVQTHGNGTGWGPPSLAGFGRQAAQATPAQPSFPFPPRPVPLSAHASMSTSTSAHAPAPPSTLPSPITQPWRMNFQSQNKTRSPSTSPPPPSSPTSPYPASYFNRPLSTSTSNLSKQQTPTQTQTRMPWTPPHSLSHLMPSLPIKPREKPKFEFITLLDTGAGSDGSSGPPAVVTPGGGNVDATMTTKVGPEVLHPSSKLPSGLIEIGRKLGLERDCHHHHHHQDEHDHEDHDQDQDHDLISITSSSTCPSLCASCCPSSCSASEVDTDHEHESEIETEGQHYSPKRYSVGIDRYGHTVGLSGKGWADGNGNESESENGATKLFRTTRTTSTFLSPLDDKVDTIAMMKKKTEVKKEKKKKFILVNDMEIELDESESEGEKGEEDSAPSSGRITSSTTTTTKETTTTITTKTTTTEKTITTTTTSNSGSPPSPRSIMVPVPLKSALWGSQLPPSSSASLITPPSTPPSEQISRYGSHINMHNKPVHSPTSSPSSASRGRVKTNKGQNSTSRERSASMGSDTSGSGGGGGSPNPSWSCTAAMRMGSPVKLKSKMS